MTASSDQDTVQHLRLPVGGGILAVARRGRPAGAAPTAVLVHGGTSTSRIDWDPLLPWLEPVLHVVTVDLRGHGESTGFADGVGIARFADDLATLLDHLALESPGLVGCSVGGHAILALLRDRPGVAGAIVTIGACRYGDPSRIRGIADGPWLPELIAAPHAEAGSWPGPGPYWRALLEALTVDWARNHRLRDADLAAIACRALVVHGHRDRVQPPAEALAIGTALADAEVFVVPGAGHMAQVHRPDLVGPAVASFLLDALAR